MIGIIEKGQMICFWRVFAVHFHPNYPYHYLHNFYYPPFPGLYILATIIIMYVVLNYKIIFISIAIALNLTFIFRLVFIVLLDKKTTAFFFSWCLVAVKKIFLSNNNISLITTTTIILITKSLEINL